MGKDTVFFDGVCNLCTGSVQWIIRHDPGAVFVFSSLQSVYALKELKDRLPAGTDSIVLMRNGKLFLRSAAVLRICGKLGFPYKLLVVFLIIPAFLRDPIYNYIAKNRYKWFGQKNECWLPDPSLESRFIA